jgi:membrane protease subunit (stomatin/prohibitin family)
MTSQSIEFTHNYQDLSTDKGFQFEFQCNRCGNGYRSTFLPSVTGTVSGVLDTASSLLGGIFGTAANVSSRVHSAAWERSHDAAFIKATQELKPAFVQCPRCSKWVCRKSCWNNKRQICKDCAPDIGVEMSAAQASKAVSEVWEKAEVAEEEKVKDGAYREVVKASCPKCGAPLAANVKFCPECGEKLNAVAHCTECGAKLQPGAKFCADCGTKVAN